MVSLKTSTNPLEQYGRRNKLVLCVIPDTIVHDELESKVTSGLNFEVESSDIEDGHRIRKSDKSNSKNICFLNRKYCRKTLLNRKNSWTDVLGSALTRRYLLMKTWE